MPCIHNIFKISDSESGILGFCYLYQGLWALITNESALGSLVSEPGDLGTTTSIKESRTF